MAAASVAECCAVASGLFLPNKEILGSVHVAARWDLFFWPDLIIATMMVLLEMLGEDSRRSFRLIMTCFKPTLVLPYGSEVTFMCGEDDDEKIVLGGLR